MTSSDNQESTISADVKLSVAGQSLNLRLTVPVGQTKPTRLLPVLRSISESLVNAVESRARAEGFQVSCKKGCGACCRQLVPISETDARRLRELVAGMPEARKTAVLARFEDAKQRIGAAGLLERLRSPESIVGDEFKKFGLGKQQLVVLVHSGSRGFGESVLRDHVDQHFANGVEAESFVAGGYLRDHDLALHWAKANRELIARRFVGALGAGAECLWDGCHNSITRCKSAGETVWVHRKGAVVVENEPVVIPGSRGAFSYLVKPIGDGESYAWSLAHGAGRKWARSEARLRMRERFGLHQLVQTPLGSRVVCEERGLLYEEAPAAYKNIEAVIQDLVDAGLVSVIAMFRPLLTYKTRAVRRSRSNGVAE